MRPSRIALRSRGLRYAVRMRGLVVVLLVGCMGGGGDDSVVDPIGPVFPGHGRDRCADITCGQGDVCTRSGACVPLAQVRAVHVSWLVNGQPASATTCTAQPDLMINIHESTGSGGVAYAPVPCAGGKFTVDRLAISFDRVELGPVHGGGGRQSATLDSAGQATLDMKF